MESLNPNYWGPLLVGSLVFALFKFKGEPFLGALGYGMTLGSLVWLYVSNFGYHLPWTPRTVQLSDPEREIEQRCRADANESPGNVIPMPDVTVFSDRSGAVPISIMNLPSNVSENTIRDTPEVAIPLIYEQKTQMPIVIKPDPIIIRADPYMTRDPRFFTAIM